jgi:UDPglucose--hexose-1-phosphate uridylyltransferase
VQIFSSRRSPEKLKYLAASESAMSVFINDVRPEEAAQMLREAIERGRESVPQDSRPAPFEARQM